MLRRGAAGFSYFGVHCVLWSASSPSVCARIRALEGTAGSGKDARSRRIANVARVCRVVSCIVYECEYIIWTCPCASAGTRDEYEYEYEYECVLIELFRVQTYKPAQHCSAKLSTAQLKPHHDTVRVLAVGT